MNTLDTLPVICPTCEHVGAYYQGRQRVYRWFRCAACGAEFSLQDRDDPWQRMIDDLAPVAVTRLRDHGVEAWFTFRTPGGSFQLGWLIDPDNGRLRRLLDYDGWLYCAMTPAAILDAIEDSERERTRRCWPDSPAAHVIDVQRAVTP